MLNLQTKNNMIKREFYETRNDGVSLYRTYSDINHYIKQVETGNVYSEAIDTEDKNYTYEETEDVILTPEEMMRRMEEEMRLREEEREREMREEMEKLSAMRRV